MKSLWISKKVVLSLIVCLVLAMASCGKKKPAVEETSETQNVVVGQCFIVTLEAEPSTGYDWVLAQPLDTNLVQVVNTDIAYPSGDATPGAPVSEAWSFQAMAEGSTSIVLEYTRFWEKGASPTKRHTVTVHIAKSGEEVRETINVQLGQTFNITLESNPSTGYSWQFAQHPDANIVKLESQKYTPSANVPGAPGKEVWVFKGVGVGSTTMVLQYQRPWETNVPPLKKDTIKVTVTPAPPTPPKEYSDPHVPIVASVGEVFIIFLESNASTGYQWQLMEPLDQKILVFLGEEYRQKADSPVGEPGHNYFTFQAKGKGKTVVKLGYFGPGEVTASKTADFNVEVK